MSTIYILHNGVTKASLHLMDYTLLMIFMRLFQLTLWLAFDFNTKIKVEEVKEVASEYQRREHTRLLELAGIGTKQGYALDVV